MSSRSRNAALVVIATIALAASAHAEAPAKRVLRIAADPNNLPFTNDKLEGFENKIAELIAKDLNAEIQYTWSAQRRGFFRDNLKHGNCDLTLSMPTDAERAAPSKPYYRSTYVFVSRKDRKLDVNSFDDPQLKKLKIGIQLIIGGSTPPGQALANHGIIDNVVGYRVADDYRLTSPAKNIIDAVAKGDVDIALVWGPTAGYFAKKSEVPLQLTPLATQQDGDIPLAFDISVGVKRSNKTLRSEIDAVLVKRQSEINQILDEYGVPRVEKPQESSAARDVRP
jgi:mxaJ protein